MSEDVVGLLYRLENAHREPYEQPWNLNREYPTPSMPEILARAIEFAHIRPAGLLETHLSHLLSPAHYSRELDVVCLPRPMHFRTLDAFAGVLLHELGHWTMKRTGRRGRDLVQEELVAEITARSLAKEYGFERNAYSDGYITGFIKQLQPSDKAEKFLRIEEEVNKAAQCLRQHFGDYHKEKERAY